MARVVQTTDEKVREAAKKFPKAKGLLEEMFPEVFPPQFKRGDIVQYKCGHMDGPFVVPDSTTTELLRKRYGTGEGSIHIISLRSGLTYNPGPNDIRKIDVNLEEQ